MKTKKKELDVDFIVGQTSLTKEQEQILREYFQKIKKTRISLGKTKSFNLTV